MSLASRIRTICFDCIWLSIFVVSIPWLAWRFLCKGKNRRGSKEKLSGLVDVAERKPNAKRVWLHAVSVGEVHLLSTLIRNLLATNQDLDLVISTTTETGYDRAIDLFGDDHQVCFFPFDFSWAVRNAIRRIDADLLVLAELELWPNMLHLAADSKLPVVVANGRLSKNSHRNYRRMGFLTRPMFQKILKVGAQDQISGDRFVDAGCQAASVSVTGNLKFDAIETSRRNPKTEACRKVAQDFGIVEGDQVFIAGSTQAEDEIVAVEAWLGLRNSFPNLKLIVVPRHPNRIAEIETLLKQNDLKANRRSNHGQAAIESNILIIDVIGELSGWWGLADVAFVGGSMGSRGGQNMIEPAGYGIPVCFGPNTSNFRSIVEGLLSNQAAVVVGDAEQLATFTSRMLSDKYESFAIGKRAQEFVLGHRGAADRTVVMISEILEADVTLDLERVA